MVEEPLPVGWFRLYDDESSKNTYINLRTREAVSSRPDADPYYVEDSVAAVFCKRELVFLRELFHEDMEHFQRISPPRFSDCLLEVGEPLPARTVERLFVHFAEDRDALTTWTEFITLMKHVKVAYSDSSRLAKIRRRLGDVRYAYYKYIKGIEMPGGKNKRADMRRARHVAQFGEW
jgi:hypothetical protein